MDGGEREAARLQRADALESLEVLRTEATGAPTAFAAREQSLPLVVADGVDGDPGPLGQFVDAPVAHGYDLKEWGTGVENLQTPRLDAGVFDNPTPE